MRLLSVMPLSSGAAGRERGGQHFLDRDAFSAASALAVLELRPCIVDDAAAPADLDAHAAVGRRDAERSRARAPSAPTPGGGRRASWSRGTAPPRPPRGGRAGDNGHQDTGPALLHVYRREVGVERARGQQRVEERPEQLRRHVVDLGLQHEHAAPGPRPAPSTRPRRGGARSGGPACHGSRAPWPVVSMRSAGSGPYAVAWLVTSSAPVGVSSSPSPAP